MSAANAGDAASGEPSRSIDDRVAEASSSPGSVEADPAAGPDDARLFELFDEIDRRAARGEVPAFDSISGGDPALGAELRALWGMASLVEGVASSSRGAALPETGVERRSGFFDPGASTDLLGIGRRSRRESSNSNEALPLPFPRRFGDYDLIEEIGRGGMGVVYRARQRSLDRLVALKVIRQSELASADDLARFRAESAIAARIDHPNAVKVYEAGEIDGQPYFTMQLIEGHSLADRLREGPLGAREAAGILAPVARAVEAAHRLGLLHRDLKPANILLDRDGQPFVADFGLAKRSEGPGNLTRSGAIVGTPRYMAPEQASGQRVALAPSTDVYSLGVILFEMLTGRPPFNAAATVDIILAVINDDPPLPRVLEPRVDRDLELVALRCLQKPQDLRYASAKDLADDLEAWLQGMPVSARSGSFRDIVARLFRETPHASVLDNWGLLWMWHAVVILVLCVVTHVLRARGVDEIWPYLLIWSAGLGAWAAIFWALRRRGGPVTFVERQIAHAWAGGVISCSGLYFVEMLLGLPVLSLSPVLGLISGTIFLYKAAVLSGRFYFESAVNFASALLMAWLRDYALIIFGLVTAASFFFPGWHYYRAVRRRESRERRERWEA
jgi:predicted Ser/Thr protein kinase